MVVSMSVVLLLVVIISLLMHNKTLKTSHALICVLLGFTLAGTSLAPTIRSTMTSMADVVSTFRP